jgi:hypothetical protein
MRRLSYVIATVIIGTLGLTAAARSPRLSAPMRMMRQGRPAISHRIATSVALDEAYGDADGNPIIVRSGDVARLDVILVTPKTTPAQLANAALQLSRIREVAGDVAARAVTYRVSSPLANASPTAEDRISGRVLSKLQSAPYSAIPRLGRVRMVEVYLPDATLRQALEQRGRIRFSTKP